MKIEILILLKESDPPRGYAKTYTILKVELSDEATKLLRQMSSKSECVIADFPGWGEDQVIEAWKELMESPLVETVVDEDMKGRQQWQTAHMSLNEIGIRVWEMLEGKTD